MCWLALPPSPQSHRLCHCPIPPSPPLPCRRNSIDDTSAAVLAGGLLSCTSLQTLDLGSPCRVREGLGGGRAWIGVRRVKACCGSSGRVWRRVQDGGGAGQDLVLGGLVGPRVVGFRPERGGHSPWRHTGRCARICARVPPCYPSPSLPLRLPAYPNPTLLSLSLAPSPAGTL